MLASYAPLAQEASAVQDWIAGVGAKTAYIERGSPWENEMKAKTKKPIVKRSVVVAGHKTSVPDVAEQGDELPTAHVGHEPPSQVTSIRTLSLPQRGRGRSEKARS
jgi:hypothetical protein